VKPERVRSPSAIRLHLLEADRMHLSAFGPAFQQPDPAHVAKQEADVRDAVISSNNVWAVGDFYDSSICDINPMCSPNVLIERWNGQNWSNIPTGR